MHFISIHQTALIVAIFFLYQIFWIFDKVCPTFNGMFPRPLLTYFEFCGDSCSHFSVILLANNVTHK